MPTSTSTFDPSLDDSNGDNKIHFGKLASTIAAGENPFETSGSVYVSADVFVGLDTPFGSITVFHENIGYALLASFDTAQRPPQPLTDGSTIIIDKEARDEKIQVHMVQIPSADANDPHAYDEAIEVDYQAVGADQPDRIEQYPVAHYSNGIAADLAHYNLIATNGSNTGNQTIIVSNIVGDGEGDAVNAVLIGGLGDDTLEYHGAGHALLIGAEGDNNLRADNPNGAETGAIDIRRHDRCHPTVSVDDQLTGLDSVLARMAASGDYRAGTDRCGRSNLLSAIGQGDFLEGGTGKNDLQGGGTDTFVGGPVENDFTLYKAASGGSGQGTVLTVPGAVNNLTLDRSTLGRTSR